MEKVTFKRTKTYQQSILIWKSVPQINIGFSSSAQLSPNGRPITFAWQFLMRYKRWKVLNNTNCETNNDDDDSDDDDDDNKKIDQFRYIKIHTWLRGLGE